MRYLFLLFAMFIYSCSSNGGSVAGGPGGQTTNGIVGVVYATGKVPAAGAKITVRPRNFVKSTDVIVRSDELSNGAEAVTDANGRFEVYGLFYGSYLMEILIGDTLGRIDTFTISEENKTIDGGSFTTQPVGVMTGVIDEYYLVNYDSVAVRIKGLDREISIQEDGSYRVEGLAPWNYEVVVQGFKTQVVVSETIIGEVNSGEITTLEGTLNPINPEQYSIVRSFLDSCNLSEIDVRDVVGLSWNDIDEIQLSNYEIESIPANVNQLSFVNRLYLDSNKIRSIPVEIGELDSLLALSLRNNLLDTLPLELGNCIGLTSLDLSENNLVSLHATLGSQNKIKSLEISNNQIELFPNEVLNLSFLSTFDMSNNGISSIPDDLPFKTPYLVVINVNNNSIDTVGMDSSLVEWISGRSVNGETWIETQNVQ